METNASLAARAWGLASAAALAILALGCASPRQVGPPIDLEKPTSVDVLKKLMQDKEFTVKTEEKDYRIGPGDQLKIYLLGRDDILSESDQRDGFKITDNPNLFLPLIGAVPVHGKTVQELEKALKEAYDKFINDARPTVIMERYNYNQVTLLGGVSKSGPYALSPNDALLDVIFKAGGLSGGFQGGAAAGRYLKIYREKVNREERVTMSMDELLRRIKKGDEVLAREEIRVPIEDYLLTGSLLYNVPIKPNDIIYVPHSGSVMVQGDGVGNAGVATLGPSLRTVAEVITTRGGLNFAAKSEIDVQRSPPEGGDPQTIRMNIRKIMDRESPDFLLQDGDKVFVDTSPLRSAFSWFGNLVKQGSGLGVRAFVNPVGSGAIGGAGSTF